MFVETAAEQTLLSSFASSANKLERAESGGGVWTG